VSDIIVREFRENAEFGLFRQSLNVSQPPMDRHTEMDIT